MVSRKLRRPKFWLYAVATMAIATVIPLLLIEGYLRLTRSSNRFCPYHKEAVHVFYPSEETTPGITGTSFFSTNSLGCRGPELNGESHRLLVVGGSTAACTALDDSEEWPHLVMKRINRHFKDPRFLWVTNSGIDGKTSRHHIMHARYLVPQIPDLDWVLVYCGLNDVGLWLYKKSFDPHFLDRVENWNQAIADSFRVCNHAPADAPWFKHLELWKALSVIKAGYQSRKYSRMREQGAILQDDRMEWLRKEQQRRNEMARCLVPRAKMDTFDIALNAYARNLDRIMDLVKEAGAEPILMAQAIRWSGLGEEEKKRLWMGAMDGGESFVEEEQMQGFVDIYNKKMQAVCARRKVEFIDLPSRLAGQSGIYFDGAHFNEKGARIVAGVVADHLTRMFAEKGIVSRATPGCRFPDCRFPDCRFPDCRFPD